MAAPTRWRPLRRLQEDHRAVVCWRRSDGRDRSDQLRTNRSWRHRAHPASSTPISRTPRWLDVRPDVGFADLGAAAAQNRRRTSPPPKIPPERREIEPAAAQKVRIIPRRGKAPGWSCPGATPTHLIEISAGRSRRPCGADRRSGRLALDAQAGDPGHTSPSWRCRHDRPS